MSVRSRRGVLGALAGALALPVLAACGPEEGKKSGASGAQPESGQQTAGAGKPAQAEAAITITPANGATGASPSLSAVTVKVDNGTLEQVVMTNQAGKEVKGTLAEDKKSWTLGEPLGYEKSYTVKASAVTAEGKKSEATSQFTTLKPANKTMPTITPGNGTFGVGQPVIVKFDEKIKDRKAAMQHLSVTTSPQVEGGWRWFSDSEVHWRPKEYWKTGTKVTVKAAVYGVDLGGGLYGEDDRSTTFSIGKSKIAIADPDSKKMQVYIDGALVKEFPVSLGKGGVKNFANGKTVDYWTRKGPHVVIGKQNPVRMTSASYGVPAGTTESYDQVIGYAVHISYAGEYVHLRDWKLGDLGKVNDSHGCINVGPGNAQWFYETFGQGDIVDVKNGPKMLEPGDGWGDWVIPYSQWAN